MFTLVAYLYATTSPPLAENTAEPIAHKLFRYSFIPHIYLFLVGALLQRLHAQRSRWIAGKGLWWLAAFLAVHFAAPAGAAAYIVGTLLMAIDGGDGLHGAAPVTRCCGATTSRTACTSTTAGQVVMMVMSRNML